MTATTTAAEKPRRSLRAYLEPKTFLMLVLGFSSGLPFLLVGNTLGYWLRDEGTSLTSIGFISMVGVAYSLKFLWAPIIERVNAPVFGFLGRRRGWMAVSQILVGVALVGMAAVGTHQGLVLLGTLALAAAFSAATQDIVIDAWRIESARDKDELGLLSSAYQFGFRVALLATDALILALAEHTSWSISYAVFGALMAIGLGATFLVSESRQADSVIAAREPLFSGERLTNTFIERFNVWSGTLRWHLRVLWLIALAGGYALWANFAVLAGAFAILFSLILPGHLGYQAGLGFAMILLVACLTLPLWIPKGLADAIAEPFIAFFGAHGWVALLMLVAISFYRVPDFIMGPMVNPYYHDIGLTKDTVAAVRASVSFIASLGGIAAGGFVALRFGYIRALILGGILQATAIAAFAILATSKTDLPTFVAIMAFDSIATSFAGVALVSYMSSLTSLGYTATQYALLASSYTFLGKFLKGFSGQVIDSLSRGGDLMHAYAVFFIGCGLAGLPGIALFLVLARIHVRREKVTAPATL
jgi:MFS family permease